MKKLKTFKLFTESSDNDIQRVKDFMEEKYTSEWFDENLSNMVFDYVDEDQAEEFEGDYEEAYRGYCNGGAIEYDLLDTMSREIEELDTKLSRSEISDLITQHMKDNCEWYDRLVFDN